MKNFIKNFLLFLILITIFISSIFIYFNDSSKFPKSQFKQRVEYFNDLISRHDSINLILGSSLLESTIIPDSIGNKWFSFTNGGQNIYESYKFLYHYKDKVKVDTIIIGINPFDFPFSYIKNRTEMFPEINGRFHYFDSDSITSIKKNQLKKNFLHYFIDNYFYSLQDIISRRNIKNDRNIHTLSKQGYLIKNLEFEFNRSTNLDSLYANNPKTFVRHDHYFFNVKPPLNFKYFDLFNDLTKSLNIKTFYLITPKSKYYLKNVAESGYDKIWESILIRLKNKSINVWNYEEMITDTFGFNWYIDETYIGFEAAKVFTEIIKTNLQE